MGKMTKRLILFMAALAVLIVSTYASGTDPQVEIERLSARVAADSQSIDARMDLAKAYLSLFDLSGDLDHVVLAESAAYHALKIDVRHVPGLTLMARALTFEGRFDDVLFVENWSITVDIENAESWGLLGSAFMELGKYRNVDSCYNQMVQLDEGFHSQVRLAAQSFVIGDIDSAAEWLSRSIAMMERDKVAASDPESDPVREISDRDMAGAYELLARMRLERGDWKAALDAADASLRVLPGFVDALVVKAKALRISREFGVARASLYSSLDAGAATSSNLKLKAELARVYRDSRWRHRSRPLVKELSDDYERLYARHPDAIRRDYALFLLEWNIDPGKALALASEESRRRTDVHTYNCLARAYHRNGRPDLAWSTVSFALRKGTNQPEILYNAAVIAGALGKIDKQRSFAERVKKLNPNFERMYGPL